MVWMGSEEHDETDSLVVNMVYFMTIEWPWLSGGDNFPSPWTNDLDFTAIAIVRNVDFMIASIKRQFVGYRWVTEIH